MPRHCGQILGDKSRSRWRRFVLSIETHALAGIVASIVAILATVPYVASILRGTTKPSVTTWTIWTSVSILLASSYYASGATNSFWITVTYAASSTLIAVLSFRYGMVTITKLDWICLFGALLSAVPWLIFRSAPGTLYVVLVIDALGAIPTISKAYVDPVSENRVAWLIAFLANSLNLFAVGTWNAQIGIFPIYAFASTGLIALLLFVRAPATFPGARISDLFVLSAPPNEALLKSVWAGIRSRIARLFSKPLRNTEQLSWVTSFYRENRAAPTEEAILDTSTGLIAAVEHYLVPILGEVETVVDLGCGDAALSRSSHIGAKIYIGVDLYISTHANREGIHFIENSIDGSLNIKGLRRGKVVFVLVNVLCYSVTTDDLKDFFQMNAMPGDLLLLVEPINSIYWENYFSKIRLSLRSIKELREFLSSSSFDVLFQSGIARPIWCWLGRVKISNTVIARRR